MNIGNYQRQLSDWMTYKRYSQVSIKNYVSCIGKFLQYFENEATKPSEISAEKIKLFLTTLKPNTHKAYLSAIKLFYDKVGRQPAKLDRVEYPKQPKNIPIVLSQDEIQRMFDVCTNIKHRVILALLYSCGLRMSELINLKWQHIDRARMVIHIINAKGNKDRQVKLPQSILILLEKYYRQEKPIPYILSGQFGEQYSPTSVRQVIKQHASKAGIKKQVWAHLIRHCCFTHMVEQGTDLYYVQKIAGHSSPKTTQIYVHMSDAMIRNVPSPIESIRI